MYLNVCMYTVCPYKGDMRHLFNVPESFTVRFSLVRQCTKKQYKITNCPNNRTISQDVCALFARYLYSTLYSWRIITGKCNMSSISSTTTSQLTQGRLKDCWHLVLYVRGILQGWPLDSSKRPSTSSKRFAVVQIANGTRLAIATKMCLFHFLRQTAITACYILKVSLDGQGYAGEKPFNSKQNWDINCKCFVSKWIGIRTTICQHARKQLIQTTCLW